MTLISLSPALWVETDGLAHTLEAVRARYAAAATAVADNSACCGGGAAEVAFGSGLYSAEEQGELPAEAVAGSLGCGNPMLVTELHPGERVLDLGSGGGIDVLLSARRVGLRLRGRHDR